MSPDQIKALVQNEVAMAAAGSQFNLNRVQFHTHNGKDSPYIYTPIITYVGFIKYNGTLDREAPFPSGWSIAKGVTGSYLITHNMGTIFYVAQLTQHWSTVPGANPCVGHVSGVSRNSFQVNWFDSATQVLTDTGFTFAVTNVVNPTPGWPSYRTNAT